VELQLVAAQQVEVEHLLPEVLIVAIPVVLVVLDNHQLLQDLLLLTPAVVVQVAMLVVAV
jgi:hypothetical protein